MALAFNAFRLRWVIGYFVILTVYRLANLSSTAGSESLALATGGPEQEISPQELDNHLEARSELRLGPIVEDDAQPVKRNVADTARGVNLRI